MEFVQKYLDIQNAIADRLQWSVMSPANFCSSVPSLILQPMVENAVKTGSRNECKRSDPGIAALAPMEGSLSASINDGPPCLRAGKRLTPEQGFLMCARLERLYGTGFN